MRKLMASILLLLSATSLFAHAGEVHKYMGTVTGLHDDGSFMMKKTDGETIHVAVTKQTLWRYADGKAAKPADLSAACRVVVTISTDGKTASEVRIAAAKG